jgi:3'-phosphoadenosine 5'-phosphosulfate sulfotransferase (PAPS reductase)/FAD synthetase
MPPQVNHKCLPSGVEQWAEAIQSRISEAFRIHGRCALPFSGGFESCLLLHLAEPWKDQVVVITLDTGAAFSHVERFLDRALTGWNRRVARTPLADWVRRFDAVDWSRSWA